MGFTRAWRLMGVVASSLMALSGCTCDKVDCSALSATIVSPADGESTGLTIDVKASGASTKGTFDVESAQLKFRLSSATEFGTPVDGSISGQDATFTGVTLPAGAVVLQVLFRERGTTCVANTPVVTVNATDSSVRPAVSAVSFPQDAAPADGHLNATELPAGTDLLVKVDISPATASGYSVVLHKGTAGGAVVGGASTPIVAGTATVRVAPADQVVGAQAFFAELTGGPVSADVSHATGQISIDRATVLCTNTTKLLNGPNDDADGNTPGFQLAATATISPDAVSATFSIASGATSPSLPNNPTHQVVHDFTLPGTGDTTYAITVDCVDAVGNHGTDTKLVRLDFVPCQLSVTSPDAGETITSTPIPFVVAYADAVGLRNASASRSLPDGGSSSALGSLSNPDGGALDPGPLQFTATFGADGPYALSATAVDMVGNLCSTSVPVQAALTNCGLSFVTPICGSTLFARDLVGGSYAVTYQSGCSSSATTFSVNGTQLPAGVIGPTGTRTIAVPMPTSGTYQLHATVANPGSLPPTVADCSVTLDLSTPAITDPAPSATPTVLNFYNDLNPNQAGAQRPLAYSATVPAMGRVDVCTTQAADPVTMVARSACADGVAGWYTLTTSVALSPVSLFTYPEGTYAIKLVVVSSSGSTSVSLQANLVVDVTLPCVSTAGMRSDRDANGDGRLSIVEYGSTVPFLSFTLGCGDTALTDLAANPVVLFPIVGGTAGVAIPATVSTSGGRINLAVTGLSGEANYLFWVQLTDKAGNRSAGYVLNTPAALPLRVDLVAPACSFVAPAGSLLGVAQVPGGNLGVNVATSADVGTNGVSVTLTGPTNPPTQTLTPAGAAHEAATTFPVTGTNSWTLNSTCTDLSGNPTAAIAKTLTVDLNPPTCAIAAPANGATLSTNTIATSVTVGGADGQSVTITSSLQGTPLGSLVVAGGTAVGTLVYPNGAQAVTATVADPAGNTCTTINNLTVNSTACGLVLNNVYISGGTNWLNRQNTTPTGATSANAAISATSANCTTGQVVTLLRTAPTMGTPVTATTNASGSVVFNQAVNDGETYSVTIDNGAAVTTTLNISVDLVAPVLGAFSIDGVSTLPASLFFVAPTDNRNVQLGTAGYFADQSPTTPGAQFAASLLAITGANGGTFSALFNGSAIYSQAVTASPQDITYTTFPAALPHNGIGPFVVRVSDLAGNIALAYSGTATIDVIAPGATVPPALVIGTPTRSGSVSLSWPQVYDDGVDPASGPHLGYAVHWTTNSVPGFANMADFWATTNFFVPDAPPAATSLAQPLALPPLNNYYIAVRAHDEVGNYSAPWTAPTAVSNLWSPLTFADATAGSRFGANLALSDLTGDGVPDLIVSAATSTLAGVGAVYIFAGGTGIASQSGCGAGCQALGPPGGAAGQFGNGLSAEGNLGELGNDLVVSQPFFGTCGTNCYLGRVLIFFGNAPGSMATTINTANYVDIRGDASNTQLGLIARIIKDINNDGLDELAVGSPNWDAQVPANANVGRVYIFKGRSLAQWQALGATVGLGQADWVIQGRNPTYCNPAATTCGNGYGRNRWGLVSLGNVEGNGMSDFVVPMSRLYISRLQVWRGLTVSSSGGTIPDSSALQTLSDTLTDQTGYTGFAMAAVGNTNILDLAVPTPFDLLVSYPWLNKLYIYPDMSPTGFAGSPVTMTGANTLGVSLAVCDLNGDTKADVVAGEGGVPGSVWTLFQRGGAFDTNLGTAANFSSAQLKGSGATTQLGAATGCADVSGDNLPDLVVGDPANGTVSVWK